MHARTVTNIFNNNWSSTTHAEIDCTIHDLSVVHFMRNFRIQSHNGIFHCNWKNIKYFGSTTERTIFSIHLKWSSWQQWCSINNICVVIAVCQLLRTQIPARLLSPSMQQPSYERCFCFCPSLFYSWQIISAAIHKINFLTKMNEQKRKLFLALFLHFLKDFSIFHKPELCQEQWTKADDDFSVTCFW